MHCGMELLVPVQEGRQSAPSPALDQACPAAPGKAQPPCDAGPSQGPSFRDSQLCPRTRRGNRFPREAAKAGKVRPRPRVSQDRCCWANLLPRRLPLDTSCKRKKVEAEPHLEGGASGWREEPHCLRNNQQHLPTSSTSSTSSNLTWKPSPSNLTSQSPRAVGGRGMAASSPSPHPH